MDLAWCVQEISPAYTWGLPVKLLFQSLLGHDLFTPLLLSSPTATPMMSSLHETELGHDDIEWPPGTIHIERVLPQAGTEVILQPRPSDDINDPLNWPQWAKHWNFALTAFYSMMVFALLDATTATWGPMGTELHYSYAFLNDGFAAGGATLALGGCLLVPFALKYGRRPIYLTSTAENHTTRNGEA